MLLYGSGYLAEMFSPCCWQWLLVCGGTIVVIGQSFWIKGSRDSSLTVFAIVSCFQPMAGMILIYWILAEVPTIQQAIDSIILRSGLLLSQVKSDRQSENSMSPELHAEDREAGGFRGL
jgi:drug/metabolite transporter (DMT)-like permease